MATDEEIEGLSDGDPTMQRVEEIDDNRSRAVLRSLTMDINRALSAEGGAVIDFGRQGGPIPKNLGR